MGKREGSRGWREVGIKRGFLVCFLFLKMGEITNIYLHVNGSNPVESKNIFYLGQQGKNCWSHVLN